MSDVKIIRIHQVVAKVGLSKTTILEMEKNGSFPKSFQIGPHSKGWLESDVDTWILKLAGKLPANDEQADRAA